MPVFSILISVSPMTGWVVPLSPHTVPVGLRSDGRPNLRHMCRYVFSAMSVLAAPVSSRAWTCSPAMSSWSPMRHGRSAVTTGPRSRILGLGRGIGITHMAHSVT